MSPNVPLGVGAIAKALGWDPRRARRWLDGLAERDPSIVVRVRGRRMTTLATLRRVCPDVAKRFASDRDVDELRAEHEELSVEIRRVARSVGELREKIQEIVGGLEVRIRKIERANSDNKRTSLAGDL